MTSTVWPHLKKHLFPSKSFFASLNQLNEATQYKCDIWKWRYLEGPRVYLPGRRQSSFSGLSKTP